MNYKILSIGQCGFDNAQLSTFCKKLNADYIPCDDSETAFKLLEKEKYSLVFVNRVFDLNGGCGLSFIKEFKSKYPIQKALLISNYKDKQELATNLGALRGFGKNELNSDSSLKLVNEYLNAK